MSAHQAESGVCIVRVEVQPEHLLITVTTNRTIGRSMYTARSEPAGRFADPDDALRAVAEFLGSFRPASPA